LYKYFLDKKSKEREKKKRGPDECTDEDLEGRKAAITFQV
jgi:hypothetical protein